MSTESTGIGPEGARLLPDEIRRRLIVVRNRRDSGGIEFVDFDEGVVQNQVDSGSSEDDAVAMVKAHQMVSRPNFNSYNFIILGVHEETRRRCTVRIGGEEVEFEEIKPQVKNIWVGERVRLLTPDEAAKTPYSSRTALYWATQGGRTPEMIVRASNGYFYPATSNDIVMSDKS